MHMLKEGSDADPEDFPSKETEVEEGTEHRYTHKAYHEHVYMRYSQLLQSYSTQGVMLTHLNYGV